MSKASAEGGRSGWQGLRFEAGFAALSLVQNALRKAPLGLDDRTMTTAASAVGATFQFQPQASAAVDDLVVLDGQRRVVAYQSKSGIGRLPQSSDGASATHEALCQAAQELRDPAGASVVVLVFGSLSSRLRQLAEWLSGDDSSSPNPRTRRALCDIFNIGDSDLDLPAFRNRLRIVAFGTVADLGTRIDLELAHRYASPQLCTSVADALRELIADRSDIEGAPKGPIDAGVLKQWLAQRALPALEGMTVSQPVLLSISQQFLDGVREARGPLPKLERIDTVDDIDVSLAQSDVALLGSGGAGKSEIEAQLLERRLAIGWTPIVVRRDDLAASGSSLAECLGAGERVGVLELAQHLIANGHRVLILVDALDEIRRANRSAAESRYREVYNLLRQVRHIEPTYANLQMIVSCRTTDWNILSLPRMQSFKEIAVPPLNDSMLVADLELADASEQLSIAGIVEAFPASVRTECLRKPLLLRFAVELALLSSGEAEGRQIKTEAELWTAYYERCVSFVDDVPFRGFDSSDVHRCHDHCAMTHIEGSHLYMEISDKTLHTNHDQPYRWLRSLDVLRPRQHNVGVAISFFSASYLDFALANALREDMPKVRSTLESLELSLALQPVLNLLPTFWIGDNAERAVERTRALLALPSISAIASDAILEGWIAQPLSTSERTQLIVAIRSIAVSAGRSLTARFFTLVRRRAQYALPWGIAAAGQADHVDDETWDEVARCLNDHAIALRADVEAQPSIAQVIEQGYERAKRLALSDAENARVAAATASRLLASCPCSSMIGCIERAPIDVSDWHSASNEVRNVLASVVRTHLVETSFLVEMEGYESEVIYSFLNKILIGRMVADPTPVGMGRPRQTEMNFTVQQSDLWTSAWYSLADALPTLVRKSPKYIDLAISSWYLHRASSSYRGELEAVEGTLWKSDGSQHWWFEHHTFSEHGLIAEAGFNALISQLRHSDVAPFYRLADQAADLCREGLVALAIDLCGQAAEDNSVPSNVKGPIAGRAMAFCVDSGALELPAVRYILPLRIASILPWLAKELVDNLWKALSDRVSLERIAALQIPEEPSLERLRVEHAKLLEGQGESSGEAKPDVANDRRAEGDSEYRRLRRDYLRNVLTPEREFARLTRLRGRIKEWHIQISSGLIPHDHPEVRFIGNVLWKLRETVKLDELPEVLREVLKVRTEEVTRSDTRASPDEEPEPDALDDGTSSSSPRATIVEESEEIGSRRINITTPLTREERYSLVEWLDRNASIAGLDEPSITETKDGTQQPIESYDPSHQPYPKRAWLRVVAVYLEGLVENDPHELNDERVRSIFKLTEDLDPVTQEAASASVSFAVRVLAAEAAALLRAHDPSIDARACILRLARDPAPKVRRALFDTAYKFARCDPALFAEVVNEYARNETDPFILYWSQRTLFRCYHDSLSGPLDASCALALERVNGLYVACQSEAPENPFEDALARLSGVAVEIVDVIPESVTEGMLRDRLRSSSRLTRVILEALYYRLRGKPSNAEHLLSLLRDVQIAFPAEPAESNDARSTHAVFEDVTRCSAVFTAALVGLGHIPRTAVSLSRCRVDIDTLMRDPLWRYREPIRSVWTRFVGPWLSSDLVVRLQRLASDVACVLSVEATLDPCRAASLLCQLRLERQARYFEPRLADQLAIVSSDVLLQCSQLTQNERLALVSLIDVLASIGNERASEAARHIAENMREVRPAADGSHPERSEGEQETPAAVAGARSEGAESTRAHETTSSTESDSIPSRATGERDG
jgi:hypothetical protein